MGIRSALLTALEANRGAYLSGQALSGRLGVSRSAVWKAVKALKLEGYEIDAAPNKGYRLAEASDRVSPEGIVRFLAPEHRDVAIHCFPVLDSTNNEAKRMLAGGCEGRALVVAERQTAGRGRRGRAFYSPAQAGAYFSLLLRPKASLADAVSITAAAAVAVVAAIEALTDKRPQIKWVNDVYLEGKKICGILTEAVTGFEEDATQGVVVGIGVNAHRTDLPEELKDIVGSLDLRGVTRNQLIAEIANRLLRMADALPNRDYIETYRAHSLVIGRRVTYNRLDETVHALAVGVDETGGLIVRDEEGRETVLHSGEITVRLDEPPSGV